MLVATAGRAERNTPEPINRRIARETEARARPYAAHPARIDGRLAELSAEWDMERVLEANAATLALAGTLLGAMVDKRFLVLPVLVTGFLLQHALQGWCPPVPFFRRRGVRTAAEIAREQYALKAFRGDFHDTAGGTASTCATAALEAVDR